MGEGYDRARQQPRYILEIPKWEWVYRRYETVPDDDIELEIYGTWAMTVTQQHKKLERIERELIELSGPDIF